MQFLVKQNDPNLYLEFQRYGIGQDKLYKLQLRKLLDEGKLNDTPELRQFIESQLDEEISDEVVNIQLKNFMDVRQVANDAGMGQEYVLRYQPDSIHVHGHWPVLRSFYLETCREPLHRMHLQPSFHLPSLDPSLVAQAILLMGAAYDLWRERYGMDDILEPLISVYVAECEPSIPESKSSSTDEGTDEHQTDTQ